MIAQRLKSTKSILRCEQIALFRDWHDRWHPHQQIDFSEIERAQPVRVEFAMGERKPCVGVVKDVMGRHSNDPNLYWPKYVRFLSTNAIPFEFVDIHRSDWRQRTDRFDIIAWKPEPSPAAVEEARTKIYFLERLAGKMCFPRYDDIWHYEDKVRQYYLLRHYGFPHVQTFVSHDREESLRFVEQAQYPLVSKINFSSNSRGVELLRGNQQAKKCIKKIFGAGRPSHWPYAAQKGYCLLQPYIAHARELRINCAGDNYWGYFRKVTAGVFRASGRGIFEYRPVEDAAILLARQVQKRLGSCMVALDLLGAEAGYLITEISTFMSVHNTQLCSVQGVAGRYTVQDETVRFEEGQFWIQELAFAEVIKLWRQRMKDEDCRAV